MTRDSAAPGATGRTQTGRTQTRLNTVTVRDRLLVRRILVPHGNPGYEPESWPGRASCAGRLCGDRATDRVPVPRPQPEAGAGQDLDGELTVPVTVT